MSRERRNRRRGQETPMPLILREACAIVDEQVQLVLLNGRQEMNDINITPRGYTFERKQKLADDLNWACSLALDPSEVTGRFTLGKLEGQDDEDAFIYLKPNEE